MGKAILLAMAAAIVAMFAIPGAASAAWTKHHANSTAGAELEMTGTDIFSETEVGGWTCTSTNSVVDFEVGTTGKITSFAPEKTGGNNITSNCQGRD